MAKHFDPARLFEPWRRPRRKPVYASDEAGLDAVQARKKGMSMFWTTAAHLAPRGSEMAEWLQLASERALTLVIQAEGARGGVQLFLSRPEELWRIPAFNALWDTAFANGRWSDGAENLMSHLLGYTAKQREDWLRAERETRPTWGAGTIYAVLDEDRRAAIEGFGRRCFGADSLALFVRPGDVVKPKALSLVPRGATLARAGVAWETYEQLVGTREKTISKTISKQQMPALNAGLLSNVQFLTRTGWR